MNLPVHLVCQLAEVHIICERRVPGMDPENGQPGRSVGGRYQEQAVKSTSSEKGIIQLVWSICRSNDYDILPLACMKVLVEHFVLCSTGNGESCAKSTRKRLKVPL